MSAKPAATLDELHARILATRVATPAGSERTYRHAVRGEEARQGRRGNGGPDLDEPAPVILRGCAREVLDLGQLLWGDRYTTDLARVTGELPRQVYRWQRGRSCARSSPRGARPVAATGPPRCACSTAPSTRWTATGAPISTAPQSGSRGSPATA
jgi:hypothetical protein